MICDDCGVDMVKQTKDVKLVWKRKYSYVFPNVGVWVCPKCGDEVYEPEDANYMLNEAKRRSEGRTDA